MDDGHLTLGGRTYRPVQLSTIAHDYWTMGQVRAAGLDQAEKGADESADDFVRRLLGIAIQTRQVFSILGGLLIPAEEDDLKWTPELGEQTAAHLQTVTDPEEKATLNGQIASLILSFFIDGLTSLRISRPSSGAVGAGEARKSPTPEPSGTGSGPLSCGNCADTTPTATPPPVPGRSGRPWWRIGGVFGRKR